MFETATLIGHRGLAAKAPENTLAGLRAAAAADLRWVEVDSRPTRDGVAVLSHDADLERCGGLSHSVHSLSAAEITALPVGLGFAGELRAERVPTLQQALATAAALHLGVVVEIKVDSAAHALASAQAAAATLATTAMAGRLLVSGFSRRAAAEVRRLLPEVPLAFTGDHLPEDWRQLADSLNLCQLHLNQRHLTAETVRQVADAGLALYAYTVNDPDRLLALLDLGAQGVFTDTDALRATLSQRRQTPSP